MTHFLLSGCPCSRRRAGSGTFQATRKRSRSWRSMQTVSARLSIATAVQLTRAVLRRHEISVRCTVRYHDGAVEWSLGKGTRDDCYCWLACKVSNARVPRWLRSQPAHMEVVVHGEWTQWVGGFSEGVQCWLGELTAETVQTVATGRAAAEAPLLRSSLRMSLGWKAWMVAVGEQFWNIQNRCGRRTCVWCKTNPGLLSHRACVGIRVCTPSSHLASLILT